MVDDMYVRREKTNLSVQEPPDATSLVGFFPAQESDKHEYEKHPVSDSCDNNIDFGRMSNILDCAKASVPSCANNCYA